MKELNQLMKVVLEEENTLSENVLIPTPILIIDFGKTHRY